MTDSGPAREEQIECLIAECLERIPQEGPAVVDLVCADFPQLLSEVKESLDALRITGLEVDQPAAGPHSQLGPYVLKEALGSGAMGIVHRAEHQETGEPFAVKVLRPEFRFFEGARERFRLECQAAARLKHPSIVPLRDFGEENGVPFLVMECIDGLTMAEALQRVAKAIPSGLRAEDLQRLILEGSDGPPPADLSAELFTGSWTDACLRVARDVAAALQHAHDNAVLHRDVKPSNIMLTVEGRVLLMDFGLARANDRSRVTRTGAVLGSQAYMPPEQMLGTFESGSTTHEVDGRSDVYALGISLYEMLSLRLPYDSPDPDNLRRLVLAGASESLRTLAPGIPADVETVCLKAMDVDPRRRYVTPNAFRADLENLLARRPIQARRPNAWLTARRRAARHPVASLAVGFAAVLLLGALGFGLAQQRLRGQATRSSERYQRLSADVLAFADLHALSADERTLNTLGELCDELLAAPNSEPAQRLGVLNVAGDVHRLQADYGRARDLLAEAVSLGRSRGADHPLQLSDSLTRRGLLAIDEGNPESARSDLEEALEIRTAELGAEHTFVADVLRLLGIAETMMFEHESGRRHLQEALSIYKLGSGSSRAMASALNTLVKLEIKQKYFDEALAALDQASEIERLTLRPTDLMTLETRDLRAQLVIRLENDQESAATLLKENLAMRRVHYGNRPLDIADNLGSLAITLRTLGSYQQAADLHDESLEIRRRLTPKDINLQAHLYAAASAHRLLGHFARARALYEEGIASLHLHYEPGENFFAKFEMALASLEFEQGDLEAAARRFEAVRNDLLVLDKEINVQAAWTDVNHALVLRQLGRDAEATTLIGRALPVYDHLLETRRSAPKPDSASLMNTLLICGQVHAIAGDTEGAVALLRESLSLGQATHSAKTWRPSSTRSELGAVLALGGSLVEAEVLLLESYERLSTLRGPHHLATARSIANLISLYEAWNRPEDAHVWSERLPPVFLSPVFRSPFST